MKTEKLLEMARAACAAAAEAGAGDADAVVVDGRSVSVEIEKNSIKSCDVEYDAGYGVRAFSRGGVGFSRGRGLKEDAVSAAGAEATAMARETEPDPDFRSLPPPAGGAYKKIGGLHDPKAERIELPNVIDWGLRCVAAAREIEPEAIVKFGGGTTAVRYALANTRGMAAAERATFASFYVFSVVRKGDDVGSYYDYTQARRLKDLKSPEEVAAEAVRRAVSFTGSRKIESGKYPLLLGPLAANSLIRSVIGASSAEEIQRGRSYLADKRGRRIAARRLTVIEDPFRAAGVYSSAFDGEGVPRARAKLIDKGVLTTYLHNSYTANKAGEENNGHAARASYMSDVGISATNLSIKPGRTPEAEIIRGMADGLYVFMASISPNPVTGQISGTVDHGFRIINGEMAYPVQNVMIGGEVFTFLNAIEAVSSDFREERGNIMPSVLIGGAQVAGGA